MVIDPTAAILVGAATLSAIVGAAILIVALLVLLSARDIL